MTRPGSRLRLSLALLALLIPAGILLAGPLFTKRIVWTADKHAWRPWSQSQRISTPRYPNLNPDFCLSYYPRRFILSEAWARKEWPLWNPYSFCGSPLLADLQVGVFYPVNWFLLPLKPIDQFPPYLLFHMAWGAAGVFLLLLKLRAPPSLAWAAGAVFSLNEYFVKNIGLPTFLATASWVPWLFLAMEHVLEKPDRRRAALLGVTCALMFLSGQPQTVVQAAYGALLFLAVRLTGRDAAPFDWKRHGKTISALAGGGVIALLLAGAQLLPTVNLAGASARSTLSYSAILSGGFHPVEMIRLVVPDFFGSIVSADSWGGKFPLGNHHFLRTTMAALFAGTPIFLLAVWGAASPGTRRKALPFTLIFLFFAGIVFGTPLARLAYEVFPGFRFSRIDRAGFFLIFAQTMLAGLGAADLASNRRGGRKLFGAAAILLLLAGALWIQLNGPHLSARLGSHYGPYPPNTMAPYLYEPAELRAWIASFFGIGGAIAFLLPAGRIAAFLPCAVAAVQLMVFDFPYRASRDPDAVFEETPAIGELRAHLDEGESGGGRFLRFRKEWGGSYKLSGVLPPSTNTLFHLRDVQGYNALCESTIGEALEICSGEDLFSHGNWSGKRIVAPDSIGALTHPILDLLSVKDIVSGAELLYVMPDMRRTFRRAGWIGSSKEGFFRWRRKSFVPRIRLVPYARGVSAKDAAEILRRGDFEPGKSAVYVGEGEIGDSAAAPGSAVVEHDGWNELTVRTDAPTEQLLVVADTYSPGWRATIDGDEAPIVAVCGIVRGVPLPPGKHEVRLEYAPPAFRRGAAASIGGLLIAAILLFPRRRRQRSI